MMSIPSQVLRDVLQDHDWHYENALGSLRMFADAGEGIYYPHPHPIHTDTHTLSPHIARYTAGLL